MKKIMNYFVMGAAILGMSAALASCQKESASDKTSTPETPAVRVIHVDLDATVAETKASYAERVVTIQDDDELYIALTGPESAWTATGTLTFATDKFSGDITVNTGSYSGSDPITDAKDLTATFLPKEYSTVGYLSAEGVATATNAFYAGEKSAAVPQLVHLTASVTNQAGNDKSPLTLVPQNAVLCYTIAANNLSAGVHFVSVSNGNGITISGIITAVADQATTFAVAFPADATPERIYTLSTIGYNDVAKTGKALVAGKVLNISTPAVVSNAPLPGVFSVGPTTTVKFSKGNLQYTKSTSTWSFMANQYSTVETKGQNVGENYASQDVVSLFCWGTKDNPYNTSTSGYSSWNEWGENTSLVSALGSGWYTLASNEWEWVLGPSSSPDPGTNCRTSSTIGSTENARFVKATVHSTNGLIIFPNEITWNDATMGDAPTTCNTAGDAFTYSPTDANWAALEAAGCVFLPAAGSRNGTSAVNVGDSACYWSSTPFDDNVLFAYLLSVHSGNMNPAYLFYRGTGYSVRLVQNQ